MPDNVSRVATAELEQAPAGNESGNGHVIIEKPDPKDPHKRVSKAVDPHDYSDLDDYVRYRRTQTPRTGVYRVQAAESYNQQAFSTTDDEVAASVAAMKLLRQVARDRSDTSEPWEATLQAAVERLRPEPSAAAELSEEKARRGTTGSRLDRARDKVRRKRR